MDYPINKPKPLVDYPMEDEDKYSNDNKQTASPQKASSAKPPPPPKADKPKAKTLKELMREAEQHASQNNRFCNDESIGFDSVKEDPKSKPVFKMVDPSVAMVNKPANRGFDRNPNKMPITPRNKSNASFTADEPVKGFDCGNPNMMPIAPRNKSKGFDRPVKGFDRVPAVHNSWTNNKPASLMSINTSKSPQKNNKNNAKGRVIWIS